jgi:1,4-dihydroxy-2-naphthoate octaprenyltransferase
VNEGATGGGAPDGRPGRVAAWLMASRPATLPAAVAPVLVGTAMAARRGVMEVWPAAAALACALLIQIATNLANDYFDYRKGGDSADRLGPTRVVQAGLLAPESVLRGTIAVMALATLVGLYLVWVGGVPILIVGILSLLCAIAYTGGPFPLAYHGLGDLFVFVFFGLVAVAGTYWVQARALTADLLVAGAGIGALITAILVVNNLRDIGTDGLAGKRTLAVRLGESGAQTEFVLLIVLAAAVPPVGVLVSGWPAWTLLALVGLGPALRTIDTVLTHVDPRELNPALREVARGVTWYGGLLATGFVLGSAL